MGKSTLPNFIVVGAPKSGTTSLFYYLKQHSDIYLPIKKELHYFSYSDIAEHSNGPGDRITLASLCSCKQQYEQHYKAVDKENSIGEISPSYFYYAHVAEQIKNELGSIKIIIMLRNPIEKAHSQYMHLVRDQFETLGFYEALLAEDRRKKDNWGDIWLYASSSLYSRRLKIYKSVFGDKNVKIIFFDDFINDPNQTLIEIFNFLGVDKTVQCNTKTIYNRSGISKSKTVAKFFSEPSLLKSVSKSLIPERLRIPLRLFLLDLNTGNKNEIDHRSQDYLSKFFKDDIKELEQILNQKTGWID